MDVDIVNKQGIKKAEKEKRAGEARISLIKEKDVWEECHGEKEKKQEMENVNKENKDFPMWWLEWPP